MILNPATTTIIYFILVYPFTHKVCKALGKQQLSGWKCPERLCPGLLLERDREVQSCSPARSPGWLQRLRGSFQVVPHTSVCPSSCHWPLSSLQSMRFPPEWGWQEVKGSSCSFYLPLCFRSTVGTLALQWGTHHIACKLQSPSHS